MAGFRVTPEELRKSASVIDSNNQSYIAEYNSIYAAVQELNVEWQGDSSKAYNQQLEGYKARFKELELVLNDYRDKLRFIADQYDAAEDAATAGAQSLPGQ